MTRVVAIIQARLASTRFPGKVLMDVAGRPLIAHVIERAQAIRGVDEVRLALLQEDFLPEFVETMARYLPSGLTRHWWGGDPSDVLARFIVVARAAEADVIVRITGDCPLLAPEIADQALTVFRRSHDDYDGQPLDYLGTTRPELAVPDGMDVEVVTRAALETAHREATDPEDREHVTRFLWRQPARFKLGTLAPHPNPWVLALKLSVDTASDLETVRAIYAHLRPGDFSLEATLRAARAAGMGYEG